VGPDPKTGVLLICLALVVALVPASVVGVDVEAGTGTAVGIGAGTVEAQVANAAITNVTVSPNPPVPGETVRFTATVENFQRSNDTFVVEAAALRTGPGREFNEYARIRDPGRIPPGASLRIPLVQSFGTTGTKDLRVVVFGRTVGGERVRLTYPVTVRVTDEDPRVAVDIAEPIEGVESNATVTVANGLDRDLRNVEVTLSGDVTVERPRRVRSTLAAGETASFPFGAVPEGSGETGVTATVEYALAGGPTRSVSTTKTVRTAALDDRVALTTNVTGRRVVVTATNLGNVEVENLVVAGNATNATVGQTVVGTLGPEESATVSLPVRDLDGPATVEVRADYEVGDEIVTTPAERVTLRSTPGRVELTGLDVQPESGHLVVTGSASNVGLSPVDSVVVRVVESEGVTPVSPNREYFVGTIPASDFVSFDVTARVDENVSEIPLRVTYLSDGQRRVEEVSAPYREATVETPDRSDGGSGDAGGGGILLPAAVGVVVVLAVGVLVYVGWRNRRVGD
jgi:hypothetical protein